MRNRRSPSSLSSKIPLAVKRWGLFDNWLLLVICIGFSICQRLLSGLITSDLMLYLSYLFSFYSIIFVFYVYDKVCLSFSVFF
jgi:hypothetical protein